MKYVAKWLLDNNTILEEFLDKGVHLLQWMAYLEFEKNLERGLDGVFKIHFVCPVHLYGYCNVELEFWLIRHNPVFLRHANYLYEEFADRVVLLDELDFVHLEGEDTVEELKKAKELIYGRLKEAYEE